MDLVAGASHLPTAERPQAAERFEEKARLDDWLAAQESAGRSPGTIAMYTNTANGWVRPHIGGLRVAIERLQAERATGSGTEPTNAPATFQETTFAEV